MSELTKRNLKLLLPIFPGASAFYICVARWEIFDTWGVLCKDEASH